MRVEGAGKWGSEVYQLEAIKMALEYPFAHGRWGTPGTTTINTDGCRTARLVDKWGASRSGINCCIRGRTRRGIGRIVVLNGTRSANWSLLRRTQV